MSAENLGEQQQGRRRRRLGAKSDSEPTPPVVAERGVTPTKGRATPSRRRQEEEEEGGNLVTRTSGGLREYLEGVNSELRKVAWPSREETTRLTIIVLATLIASSIILGIISAVFTELFRIGLGQPIILIVVIVVAVAAGVVVARMNSRRSPY